MKKNLLLFVVDVMFFLFFVMSVNSVVFASVEQLSNTSNNSKRSFFKISTPGTDKFIDYSKYGEFQNIGTDQYKYVPSDFKGLRSASGEGIYPNIADVFKSPRYKELLKEKKLEGDKWDFVNSINFELNYYKWATAQEEPGVKQYYIALALENAGNYARAIKAYYSILVFFPKSKGTSYWGTAWYVAPVALEKIKYITREHPELGIKLVDAEIDIINKYDDVISNDKYIINPGKLVKAEQKDWILKPVNLKKVGIKKTIGKGDVKLVEYNNKHYQLFVKNKPFIVRGICYSPNPVGKSPDNGTLNVSRDWMFADYNKNGIIDGPYEAWVDENKNEKKDAEEHSIGDFELMKKMGINTLRLYHYPNFNKKLLMDGYKKYGFMYMIGNFIGMYCTDSGADWFEGTDYTNEEQCLRMLSSVEDMVNEYKNEPYVLMWVLGNENNYGTVGVMGVSAGTGCNVKKDIEAYYKFVNRCAKRIKELDTQQRPVAICNGDHLYMDVCAKNAPELDIYGANAYRGKEGFGTLWKDVSALFERPVVITEYGCPAFSTMYDQQENERQQAIYHEGSIKNIQENVAGYGAGNALGGIIFEWTDEWWKAGPPPKYDPSLHDKTAQWVGPFIDGGGYEEWFGIVSIGDGKDSPFKRQLRKAYYSIRDLWKKYK